MTFLPRTSCVVAILVLLTGGQHRLLAQMSVVGRTFELQNSAGVNTIQLLSPTVTASYSLTMPAAQGLSGTTLINDGSGSLTWSTPQSSGWALTGNALTSSSGALGAAPTGSYVGTTNAVDLRLVTSSKVRVVVSSTGGVSTEKDATINGVIIGKGGGSINTNVAVGTNAMLLNPAVTGGSYLTALGHQALMNNNDGTDCTGVGARSLEANVMGSFNTAVGSSALRSNTTGIRNTAMGSVALIFLQTGSNNTAVGQSAGRNLTAGSGNVFIGYQAGYNETGDNKLYISNSSSASNTLVYGLFDARKLVINPDTPVAPSTSPPEPTGALQVNVPATSAKGLIVRGISSQTANLIEVQTSGAVARVTVNSVGNLALSPTGTGAGATNELRMEELVANGANYVALKAPDALAGNVSLTLPASSGTNGQFLATNGSGVLSWNTALTSANGWTLVGNGATDSTSTYLGTTDARPLVIKVNAIERMRMVATGQIGIGTSSPAKTLDVSGTFGASGLIYASSGVNLVGNVSSLQLDGAAGTSGDILISKGAGSTPEWKDAQTAVGIKAKGRSATQNNVLYLDVAVTNLDEDDVIIVSLEGDAGAVADYYLSRITTAASGFTVHFMTAFVGRVNYVVME